MIHYQLPSTIYQEIAQFEKDLQDFKSGNLPETAFTAKRVKMGVYQERGNETFMCRIRCAGNVITPRQLVAIAHLAKELGNPWVHITTRAEIQIHRIALEEVVSVMRELETVGLSMLGGGGHTTRNILTNSDSGTNPNEVFDVQPYAIALTSRLISEPDSFELPRKFKISFSSLCEDTANCAVQDLGFAAGLNEKGDRGFQVYSGGGLGAKPKIGILLHEFIAEDKVYHVVRSLKNVFHRYGNRRKKHHSRIRFLIHDDLGEERFRIIYREELDKIYHNKDLSLDIREIDNSRNRHRQMDVEPIEGDVEGFDSWYVRSVSPQKQEGLFTVKVPLHLGDLSCDDCFRLEEILRPFGDNVLRCGLDQNFHIRNIPARFLKIVYKGIKTIQTLTDKPVLYGRIIPCTGAQTCRLGINYPRPATTEIFNKFDRSDLDFGMLEDVCIRISGCPNACANHWIGDLGFFGKVRQVEGHPIPTYNVLGGGRVRRGQTRLADFVGWVHSKDLPRFLKEVLGRYQDYKKRKKGEVDFNRFWNDGGRIFVGDLCKNRFNHIPTFEEDKNYYFDHGATEIFSTKNISGKAECSAGIYDMMDEDGKALRKNLKTIGSWEDGRRDLTRVLQKTVFFASRMLLITRGEEPRTEEETCDLFIKHFIDPGLIPDSHRFIVQTVRSGKIDELYHHKQNVVVLGKDVIALYESMDDTMRFPGEKKDLAFSSSSLTQRGVRGEKTDRFEDLRGVKCPINFAKTKRQMASMKSGETLEIYLDDGVPIESVPNSVRREGHKVLHQEKVGQYWTVLIEKA